MSTLENSWTSTEQWSDYSYGELWSADCSPRENV